MRPEEYAMYLGTGSLSAGDPGRSTYGPQDYDARHVSPVTIAVVKRFWEETSRAAAISAGIEAIVGSTPESRALAAAAEMFWEGSMVDDVVTNHAVCCQVI
ncbi:MAG: hypothetical protein PWP08_382 [Methanofollis sp.]|nr:hypothetical protein [Methanofollis sp.]